jgi:hypothetical protein
VFDQTFALHRGKRFHLFFNGIFVCRSTPAGHTAKCYRRQSVTGTAAFRSRFTRRTASPRDTRGISVTYKPVLATRTFLPLDP